MHEQATRLLADLLTGVTRAQLDADSAPDAVIYVPRETLKAAIEWENTHWERLESLQRHWIAA